MAFLREDGDFLARPIRAGLVEGKEDSKSLGVSIEWMIISAWSPEDKDWTDWSSHYLETRGYVCLLNRKGEFMDASLDNLVNNVGWDGQLPSFGTIQEWGKDARITVEPDEYKGKTSYKVTWINPANTTPGGGLGNVDDAKTLQLEQKYGAQFRAFASRAATAPAGRQPKGSTAPPAVDPAAPPEDDDIPF